MDIHFEVIFDSGTPDLTFSLRKQDYIFINEVKQKIGEPIRLAVAPGDIELVKDFVYGEGIRPKGAVHPIVLVLDSLWTDEVIKALEANFPQTKKLIT